MYKAVKTQLIELVITPSGATQTQLNFPNQNYLNSKKVFSLETYSIEDLAKSPTNNAVASVAVLRNAYLTLYFEDPNGVDGQGQWIQLLPMWDLHRLNYAAATGSYTRDLFEMCGQKVIWEKCFITLAVPMGNAANVSFLLNVGYES